MQMPPTPTSTSMTMSDPIYWLPNQIALTLFSTLPVNAPAEDINSAVNTDLQEINSQALGNSGFQLGLQMPGTTPVPTSGPTSGAGTSGMPAAMATSSALLPGVYVYAAPNQPPTANIAVFCNITEQSGTMASARMDGGTQGPDQTLQIVRQINTYESSGQAQAQFLATPNWLWSGVDVVPTHGCPVSPPFPAENSGNAGQWKITLPPLPSSLQNASGACVTVFVLDTLPSPAQITAAVQLAENQNTLLQSMALGMVTMSPFNAIPPAINLNSSYPVPTPMASAVTGKDIYGRLSGFPMADHGLFIAGQIRDLAANARIECIRVLNDFGVGDLQTLTAALADIGSRLQNGGDLQNQPVVINLSMVVGPPEADQAVLNCLSLSALLGGLRTQMESLAGQGVIFVASVGNDSDPRDFTMNPNEVRFGARYPAAFANETPPLTAVIPVGALNYEGEPTIYSNYPGLNGISSWGGELPEPCPWVPSAMRHKIAHVDTHHLDAIRGVYTATTYPALSRNDSYPFPLTTPGGPDYPLYEAPSTNAWACWSGTSFAAPIITALVARVLEVQTGPVSGQAVLGTITAPSTQTLWSGLENGPDAFGPTIRAAQEWWEV